MRGVGKKSVAMGIGVAGAIHGLSNAIQNFYNDALNAALTLPSGILDSVDAFKELENQIA